MRSKEYFEKEKEFLDLIYKNEGKLYSKSQIHGNIKVTQEI